MRLFGKHRSLKRPRADRRTLRRELGLEQLERRLALTIALDVFDNTGLGTAGDVSVTGHGIPGAPGAPKDDLRVLAPSGSFTQGAVKIATASWTGGTAKVTTSVEHQLKQNDQVFVSSMSVPGYNGVFRVTAVELGPTPTWFEYAVAGPLPNASGGAAYLPTLLSSHTISSAEAIGGGSQLITVTLDQPTDLPLNSPIVVSGLSGAGADWNGEWTVSQNPSSDSALGADQFQFTYSTAASGTATLSDATVQLASLRPVALATLPVNQATDKPSVALDEAIATYSSQFVVMVTPAGVSPYPLGLTPGTIDISNLGIPPFGIGTQTGTAVADIVEFFYAGSGRSTFDVSQVDGFALPLTLTSSKVTPPGEPTKVGVNPKLTNLSRQGIGEAFSLFINNEPAPVQAHQFNRLLYTGATDDNPLVVGPAAQPGTPLTGVSMARWTNPDGSVPTNIITLTTVGPHGLVPGQAITIESSDPQYQGSYTVANTGLTPGSGPGGVQLLENQFTVNLNAVPANSSASGIVTPTNAGVIATSAASLVVAVTLGTPPASGTVQLSDVPDGSFSIAVNGPYTVLPMPADAGLPANAVYLATTTGQTFSVGDSSGGGTLSTPVFTAPPAVPDDQFYAIAAPKDWLANQPVSTANDDPLVTWWDATVNDFFKAGNFLQVAVGTGNYTGNYTGTYNAVTNAFDFRTGLATTGTVAFSIAKPTPENVFGDKYTSQSQSLANATWVWGQGNIPGGNRGLVWDQIVAAFCRGVALDGVFTSAPATIGQSNTAWTVVSEWYRNASTYCPFSKFVHYATLTGATDRTGTESIYVGNYAYGFSEDETPLGPSGTAIATQVPSKMDGTVPDGETVTLTINPWLPATAPTVVSIDTATKRDDQPTTAASVVWTVTFSQPVSGVTAANFALEPAATLAGTSITEVRPGSSGSTSQTWTVTASTGTGYGLLGLDMTSASGVKNANDEPLRLSPDPWPGQRYNIDRAAVATLTIPGDAQNPTDAATVAFDVAFTEAVTGLNSANFAPVMAGGVTGATIQQVAGSGTAWTVTVATGSGSGSLGLTLANDTGLTPTVQVPVTSSQVYKIDKHTPTDAPEVSAITRAGASPTAAASVSWTVSFSEPVTGVMENNFTLVPGGGLGGGAAITTISPASSSSTATWTVTASGYTGSGTLGLNLTDAAGITDAEDQPLANVPPAFEGGVYTIDRTAPAVTAISRTSAEQTALPAVSWRVTFSKPVAGVSRENFQLVVGGGLKNTALTSVSGGGSSWTVTAKTGSGSGSLRLDMVNVTGITDTVDLPPTGVPFVGQQYEVDRKTAPIDFAPTAFWATAGAASPLVWPRGLTPFVDGGAVQLDVTLAVTGAGRLEAASAGGVTVNGSGGTELTFSGDVAALDAYFRQTGRMAYTPTGGSLDPRFVTLSSSGSDGLSGGTTSVILVKGAAATSPAPAIDSVGQLGPAHVSRPLEISYAQLATATGATPMSDRSLQFMLSSLQSGRLEVRQNGEWHPALTPSLFVPNPPLLAPGGLIRWTPATTTPGTINAFQVKVFDGSRYSAAAQIQITTVDSYQSVVWDAGSFFVSATNTSRRVLDVSARSQPQTLTVSLAAAGYLIDGEENPTLVVSRGQTYRFDLNVPGEPFTLQTIGGGYDLAFVYNEGVSGNGETAGQLIWAVPETGPDELFYQSAATPEFGGKIIVARLPLD